MKKIYFSILLLIISVNFALAQNQNYRIADLDGVNYVNNSLHIFNVHGTFADPIDEAKLHLVVNNDASEQIYVTAQIVEITNTDGTMAQFCIGGPAGNCFFPLVEGAYYPAVNGGVIEPGSNWGNFDYLINLDSNNLAEYKVRFVELDGAGNQLSGTDFFLTYRYDENMATTDVNSIAIADVNPTVVKGFTNVTLKENAQVQVVNLEGKVVKTLSMKVGSSTLDFSGVAPGVYWIQFKGVSGTNTMKRVVVK